MALETEPPSSSLNRRVSRQLSSTLGLPSAHELAKAHPHLSNLGRGTKAPGSMPRRAQSARHRSSPENLPRALAPVTSGIPMPSADKAAGPLTRATSGLAANGHGSEAQSAASPQGLPIAEKSEGSASDRKSAVRRTTGEGKGVRFGSNVAAFDGPGAKPAGLGVRDPGSAAAGTAVDLAADPDIGVAAGTESTGMGPSDSVPGEAASRPASAEPTAFANQDVKVSHNLASSRLQRSSTPAQILQARLCTTSRLQPRQHKATGILKEMHRISSWHSSCQQPLEP